MPVFVIIPTPAVSVMRRTTDWMCSGTNYEAFNQPIVHVRDFDVPSYYVFVISFFIRMSFLRLSKHMAVGQGEGVGRGAMDTLSNTDIAFSEFKMVGYANISSVLSVNWTLSLYNHTCHFMYGCTMMLSVFE